MAFMFHSLTCPFWHFLASYECYYKDLTASHNKSRLCADALHRACCYFQIPAGSERFILSLLGVSNSIFPERY